MQRELVSIPTEPDAKKKRPLSSVEPGKLQKPQTKAGGKKYYSGGISQLDERTDMTSLNKDSTFEREDLSEMLSAGKKTQNRAQKDDDEAEQSIGAGSHRKANEMAQLMNFKGSQAGNLVDTTKSLDEN